MTKRFSVLDFGAQPNLEIPQTDAFQKALDACFLEGGGEVVVPTGSYVIGDIRIRSNTTFHLMENACLKGSLNPKDYFHIFTDVLEPLPEKEKTNAHWGEAYEWAAMNRGFKTFLYTVGSYWNYGLIRAAYAENICIIGEKGSKIDGRNVFDPEGESAFRGPHAISMQYCKNVLFDGYTMENSANWSHWTYQSQNLTFRNLTILGGHDGIHTRTCNNVSISNCKIVTGDDCIAGFDNIDVTIQNCEMSSACSVFRYSGRNVLVENCHTYAPCPYQFRLDFTPEEKENRADVSKVARNNGLSFWTNFGTGELPVRQAAGNIVVRNCSVKNIDRFLHLNFSGNEAWQSGIPPTDILFENIKAEGIKYGLTAYALEEFPTTLTLKNMEYSADENFAKDSIFRVAHCDEIRLENVKIFNYKGKAFIRAWSKNIDVQTENLDVELNGGSLLEYADEKFTCKPI